MQKDKYETVFSYKNTAPDHDYESRNILRKLTSRIHEYIFKIYNLCITNHTVPENWKTWLGNIHRYITKSNIIHKPNQDHSKPENYIYVTK